MTGLSEARLFLTEAASGLAAGEKVLNGVRTWRMSRTPWTAYGGRALSSSKTFQLFSQLRVLGHNCHLTAGWWFWWFGTWLLFSVSIHFTYGMCHPSRFWPKLATRFVTVRLVWRHCLSGTLEAPRVSRLCSKPFAPRLCSSICCRGCFAGQGSALAFLDLNGWY